MLFINQQLKLNSQIFQKIQYLNCLMIKPTKCHVRPAKTQISLGIRPVWSESSLSAWRKLGSLATHWAHSEDWSESSLGTQSFFGFCHVVSWGLFVFISSSDYSLILYSHHRILNYIPPQIMNMQNHKTIMLTSPCNLDPRTPLLYSETGVFKVYTFVLHFLF